MVAVEDHFYLNTVSYPNYYCIQNIPDKLKRVVDDKLMQSKHNMKFKEIVKFMWLKSNKKLEWDKFLSWTKRHDEYRKESFADTFSQWHELIYSGAINAQ